MDKGSTGWYVIASHRSTNYRLVLHNRAQWVVEQESWYTEDQTAWEIA